jgi:hypothetical protein
LAITSSTGSGLDELDEGAGDVERVGSAGAHEDEAS